MADDGAEYLLEAVLLEAVLLGVVRIGVVRIGVVRLGVVRLGVVRLRDGVLRVGRVFADGAVPAVPAGRDDVDGDVAGAALAVV